MEKTKQILSKLTSQVGVAGEEFNVLKTAVQLLEEYGDGKVHPFTNNFHFNFNGYDDSKPTVLLDAHIDEIGMIVTYITDEGFLKVSSCGGIDMRVMLAQQVAVYGREKILGVVTSTPPHLEKDNSKVPAVDEIYIDIGYTKEQAQKLVSLGDRVLIENQLACMYGDNVTSKALDDRSGMTAIILALDLLKDKELNCNVSVLFSAQEETGERGAKTGAYSVNPDMAIAVDVSFAKTAGESESDCGIAGKGPMIGIAPSLNRKMSNSLIEIAKEENIPYQIEVMNGKTGTNADEIGVTRNGVPTVTVSIPVKYMHTPVEVMNVLDIENTAKLIAKFLERVFNTI